MKKYLFILISVIFLTGCSFKDQVISYEKKFDGYTAEELATLAVLGMKKELPMKKTEHIDGHTIHVTLTKAYSKKNDLYLDVKLESSNNMIKENEFYDFLVMAIKLGKFNEDYKKFCISDAATRAMINSGVVVNMNMIINKRTLPMKIDKQVCEKYASLE